VTEPTAPSREVGRSHRTAAALTLLEALVVLGFAVFYVYEMVTGATDDLTRAATSGALILVFGIALLALARAWARASQWARTPTVLWNVLLLPVAWSLHESDRDPVALAVGAVAVASIAAAIASPGRRDDGPDGESDVVS
jgi:peptidoglycan/LPS O-acetylase OafA/YrhL